MPSIGTIGDVYDNAASETVMGLFKNEAVAVAVDSPFRTVPLLMAESYVTEIVVDWVHWYCKRLHSPLGYRAPVEFEELYYDEIGGWLPDEAARKLAA